MVRTMFGAQLSTVQFESLSCTPNIALGMMLMLGFNETIEQLAMANSVRWREWKTSALNLFCNK